ncbi:hypothetical protein DXG01_008589 [Tephrocybe rancida]|nr:hypothetical protein DXG01_008589 [Tephrocybe rancida]
MADSLIDLTRSTPHFSSTDWIGVGKKYPTKNIPPEVLAAKADILRIPEHHTSEFPLDNLPATQFIALQLPRQSSDILSVKVKKWFSHDEPSTDVHLLLNRPIPSKMFLTDLADNFGQAWFNGAKSIIDPRYNGGTDRFPLWTLSFWNALGALVEKQEKWKRGDQWINDEFQQTKNPLTKKSLLDAKQTLATMGWNVPLSFSKGMVTTMDLALLLGSGWLTDEHISMITADLSNEVASDPVLKDKIIIAPLSFARDIIYATDPMEHERTIPKPFNKALLRWLQMTFKRGFRCRGNTLPCGEQRDSYSCGVIFANTIHHAVSGVSLWDQGSAILHRVNWFLRFTKKQKDVSQDVTEEHIESPTTLPPMNALSSIAIALGDHNFPDLQKFAMEGALPSSNPPKLTLWRTLLDLLNPMSTDNTQVDAGNPDPIIEPHIPSDNIIDSIESLVEDTGYRSGTKTMGSDWPMENSAAPSEFGTTDGGDISDWAKPVTSNEISPAMMEIDSGDVSFDIHLPPKRKREDLVDPSDTETDTNTDNDTDTDSDATDYESRRYIPPPAPRPEPLKKEELSKVSKIYREASDARKVGTLKVDEKKYGKWKKKILTDDVGAEFDGSNARKVRHSICGSYLTMKTEYDMSQWSEHRKLCTKEKPLAKKGAGMQTLQMTNWFKKLAPAPKDSKKRKPNMCPCPGITINDDPRVPRYLGRTAVPGGGSQSVKAIAGKMFKSLFSSLRPKQKKKVLDAQQHNLQWKNNHKNLCVFATACEHVVPEPEPEPKLKPQPEGNAQICSGESLSAKAPVTEPGEGRDSAGENEFIYPRPLPCKACMEVFRSRAFKTAIQKPTKDSRNYICINHRFRCPLMGEVYAKTIGLQDLVEKPDTKRSPCIRFALGVLNGEYNNEMFEGLVQAVVLDHERDARGVGRQNFRYAPAWEELCHVIKIHSPKLYVALSAHLPMPAIRTFRMKEARQPKFPTEICEQCFILVIEHLSAVNYTGPVGCSCDDTKLFSSLRLYWDSNEQSYFLIGGTDGPHQVLDPDDVKQVLAEGKITKATKVRLWTLTLPAPNVPPVLVAVLPIPNDTKADTLLAHSERILTGLIDCGVKVISYACDGTEVKHSVQRLLINKSEKITHIIKSPCTGCPDTSITFIQYESQAMAIIQDSKHALKTFCNNLFSGAHLLALGNFTAFYEHIHQIASENGTPIYKRDVEKLDRQDDNAATRLFSSEVLRFIADNHPDWVGVIVYLFVFGELVDAYQNRSIPHIERVKMVLRARYFLDSWEKYLDVAEYPRSKYFLSREATDIARIIIEGYISLIYIHRDHLPSTYPLLPWLHSTEACEHAFGEARKIIKDFTLLDLVYMVPKLRIKIREAIVRARGSDAKARAAGYNHTYVDHSGINIPNLSMFPSDREINQAASDAAQEADSLLVLLGLAPRELHRAKKGTVSDNLILPSIDAWYGPDAEDHEDLTKPLDDEHLSEAQQLQVLLDQEEDRTLSRTKKQDDRLRDLSCAAVAIVTDEMMKVQFVADINEEDEEEYLAQEQRDLEAALTSLPAVQIADELEQPLGRGTVDFDSLNYKMLITMRREHETNYAAKGIRTRKDKDSEAGEDDNNKKSLRWKLIREFHDALKEGQDDHAIGTGMERDARWHGGSNGTLKTSGNAANAAAAAAAEMLAKKANVPCLSDVGDARVTQLKPLNIGSYGIVLDAGEVKVGRVVVLYMKSGGKHGKHGSVLNVTNISAASHISVELYEQLQGRQFRETLTSLKTKQCALLAPSAFLCLISTPPNVNKMGPELKSEDADRFNALADGETRLKAAVKLFGRRKLNLDDA